MPGPVKIDLHYDIGSPKSWIALELLLRYAPVWNLEVELFPGLLGAVHKRAGNVYGQSRIKNAHAGIDLKRDFAMHQLNGSTPPFFGGPDHNFLGITRLLRAIKTSCSQEQLLAASRALYAQCWTNHFPPTSPQFVSCLVPSVFTKEQLEALITMSTSVQNKDAVKREAESLVDEYGAFGFPWIVVHMPDGRKECFFGADRLESMSFVLGPDYVYSGPFPRASEKSRL